MMVARRRRSSLADQAATRSATGGQSGREHLEALPLGGCDEEANDSRPHQRWKPGRLAFVKDSDRPTAAHRAKRELRQPPRGEDDDCRLTGLTSRHQCHPRNPNTATACR